MKLSKVLVILVFIVTVALGGAAIWIGWRLSQEEEVTPAESEAYTFSNGDIIRICAACDPPSTCTPSDWDDPARVSDPCIWGTNGCDVNGCTANASDGCYIEIDRCTYEQFGGNQVPPDYKCSLSTGGERDPNDYTGRINYTSFFTNTTDPYHSSGLPVDCLYLQIDVWCPGAPNVHGRPLDWVIWRGGRVGTPACQQQQTTTTTTTLPPTTTTTTTSLPTTTTTTTTIPGQIVCGDECGTEGTDCDDGTTCVDHPIEGLTCLGADWADCDVQEHIANNCECPEEECDCESITRSPSGDTIAAGTEVWFQIEVSCELTAAQVQWFWSEGENGTPQTSNLASRDPLSGPARNHSVVFSVPATATGTLCVWARTDGDDDPDCSSCFQVADVPPEPAFAAVKTSSIECINNNTAARITYTINVRNISEVEGIIDSVQDTYDSRIQSSWVGNITPTSDSHTGNVIRWDNNDAGYTLQANDGVDGGADELVFSYIVTVPSEYFGTYDDGNLTPYQYRNHAVVQPQDQEAINLETVVEITCLSSLPGTGIIDEAMRVIIVAYLLLLVGLVGLRLFGLKELEVMLWKLSGGTRLNKQAVFEKRAIQEVERQK